MAVKTHILRLGSVVKHGVGGPEAGMMDLIYSFLLQEFKSDIYNHISINQIGQDLDEFIIKQPNNSIHINIRYQVFENFELKSSTERNRIRLDVIHESLVRIAENESKIEVNKLQAIKQKILDQNFCFDFVYKTFNNKKKETLSANVVINPENDQCNFFIAVEEDGKQKCKQLIYTGLTSAYYIKDFFSKGKWIGINEFVIHPKKEFEIHLLVDQCSVGLVNLTNYDKPPLYEIMRAKISKEEKAYNNWTHSLPPAIAAIINHEPN